ncbi:unnamed protein product [Heterosigma akashiwo]|mmetsp:Transcript_9759/g.15034  ORF Transcript_9759/g.15034 Transcript_9759/m.15034 type:complete len:154 (-) Transcript_9759:231-692(-)
MPIHSVLISNMNGALLLSKHFNPDCESWESKIEFERELVRATRQQWAHCLEGTEPQFSIIGREICVCFQKQGDLLFFVSGTDEYDELALQEIVTDLIAMVNIHCEQKTSEEVLLQGDAYGKIVLGVNEMMPQGILEHCTVEEVLRMSKLKPLK